MEEGNRKPRSKKTSDVNSKGTHNWNWAESLCCSHIWKLVVMRKWLEYSLLKSAFRWGRKKEKAFYKSHLLASLHFCLKQFQKQTLKSSWLADPAPRFSHSAGHTSVSLTHGFVPGQHSAPEQEDTVLWNQPSTASKGTVLSPSFFTCK